MSAITLGFAPQTITVALCRGASFDTTIRTSDGSAFPTGAAAELRFGPRDGTTAATWAATVTGSQMSWDEDAAAVTAVIDAAAYTVRLYYLDAAGTPILWAVGGAHVY